MTHIRGDITKVYEVLKKGYEQPIVQVAKNYTITTGAIAPGVTPYALPNITPGYIGYIKKISATCDNAINIHEVTLRRISATGDVWAFFDSYFFIGKEWNTGDVAIAAMDTWTVSIDNNAAGNVSFTVNVFWIESPIV